MLKERLYIMAKDDIAQEDAGKDPGETQQTPQDAATGAETSKRTEDKATAVKTPEISLEELEQLKAKARKLEEIEEANKTELEKAQERANKAEERAAKTEAEANRIKVAAAKGVDASLLSGPTVEELEAQAEALIAWRDSAKTSRRAGSSDIAGDKGGTIESAPQLTREDLAKMTPEDIVKARKDGRLNNLMGVA